MSNTRDSGELSLAIASTQAGSVPTIGNNRKWGATVRTAGFDSRRPLHAHRGEFNDTNNRRLALRTTARAWAQAGIPGALKLHCRNLNGRLHRTAPRACGWLEPLVPRDALRNVQLHFNGS